MNALQNYRLHEACRQLRLLRVIHTTRHPAPPLEQGRNDAPMALPDQGADAEKKTLVAILWHPEDY